MLPQIPIRVPCGDECHYEQEHSLFVWRSKSDLSLMALHSAQGSDELATMCERLLVLQRLYVTMFPCNECAKLLIQAGITEVVFYEVSTAVLLPIVMLVACLCTHVGSVCISHSHIYVCMLSSHTGQLGSHHDPYSQVLIQDKNTKEPTSPNRSPNRHAIK